MRKNREQKRNAPTLVLPNEDVSRARLSPTPRDESKPLMRGGHNVTKVVSPYSQCLMQSLWYQSMRNQQQSMNHSANSCPLVHKAQEDAVKWL